MIDILYKAGLILRKDKSSDLVVSVIVPAYNVEKYIRKCIESILEQDYKNIEILIINDGSTDNTSNIIDELKSKDNRISVVHNKNSGVSSSRNKGIELSTGDYLVFIDGDDYISIDFISYMVDLVKSTNSDFCISKYCYLNKNDTRIKKETIEKLTSEDATSLLLSPDVVVGCWNKIYNRKLIISNNVRFSTSLFYGEGLTFITDISQIVSSVGVGNRKVYYYRRNNESSATTKFDINKIYNGEKALLDIKDKLKIKSNKINIMFDYHLCLYRLGAIVKIISNGEKDIYFDDYIKWITYIRNNSLKFIFFKYLSIYRKLLLVVGAINPSILVELDKIRCRHKIKNSVDG